MADSSLIKRKRASVPHLRTGCKTCKARHVKCDEGKPSCQKCLKTGRTCEGYEVKPLKGTKRILPSAQSLAISSYSIPFKIPGSATERRYFHYFCVQAAPDLSGYFNPDFWTKQVLQQSQHEPAVRHALIALGKMHCDFITNGASDFTQELAAEGLMQASPNTEALEYYGRAMKQLRRRLKNNDKPSLLVRLMCSIIFYHFETSYGNIEGALAHLENAIRTLQAEVDARHTFAPQPEREDADVASLRDALARLDMQATFYNDSRLPKLTLTTEAERSGQVDCIPDAEFRSLDDASSALVKLENWFFHFLLRNLQYHMCSIEEIPQEILDGKNELIKQFSRWKTVYEHSVEKLQLEINLTDDTANAAQARQKNHEKATLLSLHHLIITMLLKASLPWNQECFSGGPGSDAETLLALAECLIPEAKPMYAAQPGVMQGSNASSPMSDVSEPRPIPDLQHGQMPPLQPGNAAASRVYEATSSVRSTAGGSRAGTPSFAPANTSAPEHVTGSPGIKPPPAQAHRSYHADTGVIAPLLVMTFRTRDVAVRNRSQELLTAASSRREGLYNGQSCVSFLEKFLQLAAQGTMEAQAMQASSPPVDAGGVEVHSLDGSQVYETADFIAQQVQAQPHIVGKEPEVYAQQVPQPVHHQQQYAYDQQYGIPEQQQQQQQHWIPTSQGEMLPPPPQVLIDGQVPRGADPYGGNPAMLSELRQSLDEMAFHFEYYGIEESLKRLDTILELNEMNRAAGLGPEHNIGL